MTGALDKPGDSIPATLIKFVATLLSPMIKSPPSGVALTPVNTLIDLLSNN
jgi:hypothetical protein